MITKEMSLGELVEMVPPAAEVLKSFGIKNVGRVIAQYDTLEQCAGDLHIDLDDLLCELSMAATNYEIEEESKCRCGCGGHGHHHGHEHGHCHGHHHDREHCHHHNHGENPQTAE